MRIGMVGLGRMGGAMVRRFLAHGIEVVAYDHDPGVRGRLEGVAGAHPVASLSELLAALPERPRRSWVMLPAGDATGEAIERLAEGGAAGDIILDGGNSRYTDTLRRAAALQSKGLHLVDVGTSGGIHGEGSGFCLMVGGSPDGVEPCRELFQALAAPGGFEHVGGSGAGHFTKMVHNGIEYGMLQAYAEGFELLHAAPFDLDPERIAALWMQGSVVRSWLLELLAGALAREGRELERIQGWVADSGEGRWALESAIELEVPAPVLALSLFARFHSRQPDSYAARIIAALRGEFGGHAVRHG